MYSVELYVKVRRAVMVDKVSEREAARRFGVHVRAESLFTFTRIRI